MHSDLIIPKLRLFYSLYKRTELREAIHPRRKGKLQRDRSPTQPTTAPRKPATTSQKLIINVAKPPQKQRAETDRRTSGQKKNHHNVELQTSRTTAHKHFYTSHVLNPTYNSTVDKSYFMYGEKNHNKTL